MIRLKYVGPILITVYGNPYTFGFQKRGVLIICLIEFEVIPGKEDDQKRWLEILMPEVERVPGFRGKESFAHISGSGRVCTVSYWDDEASLEQWTQDKKHRTAMKQGREKIFLSMKSASVQNYATTHMRTEKINLVRLGSQRH